MSRKIVEKTKELVSEIAKKYDIELVDVEYVKEDKNRYLRVYIYKPTGITLDDCQNVHQDLNEVIDDEVDISEEYFLEVSSPGYERAFKYDRDFERYIGSKVKIKLYKAYEGKKTWEGFLKDYKNQKIYLETDDGIVEFEKDMTSKVTRVFEF